MEGPATGKRERAKIAKRAAILAAARELFRTQGYEATTTSALSRRAGIATGTLFLYFPTKDEVLIALFSEALHDHIAQFSRNFDAAVPARAQITAFFADMIALHGEDPALTRQFIRAIAIIGDRRLARDVDNLARAASLALCRALIALQRAGAVDPSHSPRTAAQILFGTYFTSLVEWANGGIDDGHLQQRLTAAVDLMLRALSPK